MCDILLLRAKKLNSCDAHGINYLIGQAEKKFTCRKNKRVE